MEHESPPLYSRGPYRVVQCRAGDEDRPGALPRFAIVTASGERLHETVSFDAARIWLDLRIEQEQTPPTRRARERPLRR